MPWPVFRRLAAFETLFVWSTGAGMARLLVPQLVRQFDPKRDLTLSALGMPRDTNGRLWMATTNDVVCFDGRLQVYHDPLENRVITVSNRYHTLLEKLTCLPNLLNGYPARLRSDNS